MYMDESLQMLLVMQDDQFQEILRTDHILNQLQQEKNNKKLEYFQLMSVISKSFFIGGVNITPITPILWSFLYCIDNRFVTQSGQIRHIDIDVFFYLLHYGIKSISDDLFDKAKGFCTAKQISYDYARDQILQMIHLAFRPLQMFPQTQTQKTDVKFNLDWLTKIVALCAKMTNKKSDQIMFDMSLTQVLSYVVQACRQGDVNDSIRRRNSDQVNEAMYKRTLELGKIYYQKNYKNR